MFMADTKSHESTDIGTKFGPWMSREHYLSGDPMKLPLQTFLEIPLKATRFPRDTRIPWLLVMNFGTLQARKFEFLLQQSMEGLNSRYLFDLLSRIMLEKLLRVLLSNHTQTRCSLVTST